MQFQLPAAFPRHMGRQNPDETLPKESCDSGSQVDPMKKPGRSRLQQQQMLHAQRHVQQNTLPVAQAISQKVTGHGGIWSVPASQRARRSHQLCLLVFQPPSHGELLEAARLLAQLSTPEKQIHLKASPQGIPPCLISEDRDLRDHY